MALRKWLLCVGLLIGVRKGLGNKKLSGTLVPRPRLELGRVMGPSLGCTASGRAVSPPGVAYASGVCVPGGILAGLISDYTSGRATTCCIMLIVAAPMVRMSFRTKCVHACKCVPVGLNCVCTCFLECVHIWGEGEVRGQQKAGTWGREPDSFVKG